MAKRRARAARNKQENKHAENPVQEHHQTERKLLAFSIQEVERRISAILAIRDAEKETLLMRLRLLRSLIAKEQLEMPALEFFKKNLPNLSVVQNEKDGEIELQWKVITSNVPPNPSESNIPGCAVSASIVPDISSFEFSSKAVETGFFQAASLHIPDFVLGEMSATRTLGLPDVFQTPGATNQRLSIGVTPKTLRLPKNGEMLLSVHGSPLGVYKEENMETIQESAED